MQQCRRCGREQSECAKEDERAVEAHDKAVITRDALHQLLGEPAQQHQLPQILSRDGDICHLTGNRGAAADGNAHIGKGERRGIVDAVADHDDSAAPGLFVPDVLRLILRQDLRVIVVDHELVGNGCGGIPAVPGEHDGLVYPGLMQQLHDLARLRTKRIENADRCREYTADSQIQPGAAGVERVKRGLILRADGHALILEYEVAAADDGPFVPDPGSNAVGDHVLRLAVHLPVVEPALLRSSHDGVRDRMGEMLLQTGRHTQHLALVFAVEGDDLRYRGAGVRQGAGLVEDHGIGLTQLFEEFAALDRDFVPPRLPDPRDSHAGRDHLTHRHGQEQLFEIVAHHAKDQLFLVLPVDGAAVAAEDMGLFFGKRIRESSETLIKCLTLAVENNDDAADALVHRHMLHARQGQQPRLQQVRLFHAHGRLDSAQTHAPPAFMQNLKFHQAFAVSSI